jgi:hypothetical protein
MLALVFAAVIFVFLVAGAVAFVVCIAIPPLRRFALSTALWFAACGPSAVALLVVIMLGEAADAYLTSPDHHSGLLRGFQTSALPTPPGWAWIVPCALAMAAVATVIAWLHQKIVRRSTLPLFRLYATAVSVAIGAIFGLCFEGWMLSAGIRYAWVWWLISMPIFIFGFGFFAYRGARSLRGKAPTRFTWISVEEYDGV